MNFRIADTFTGSIAHGTSVRRGLETGDFSQGDTFTASLL